MKITPILNLKNICIALAAIGLVSNVQAQYVIGDWQTSTSEGWVNPANGLSITDPANTSIYSFQAAGVPGYAQSLQISGAGYGTQLRLNLASIPADLAAFNVNNLLSFTFGVPADASTSGYNQVFAMSINAPGYGFNNIPWTSTTSVNVAGANNNTSGMPNYYYGPSPSVRAQTVTFDYSSILPAIILGGESYLELTFTFNNGGGSPPIEYMNNVVLSGAPVPEPATMALMGLGALVGTFMIRRRK